MVKGKIHLSTQHSNLIPNTQQTFYLACIWSPKDSKRKNQNTCGVFVTPNIEKYAFKRSVPSVGLQIQKKISICGVCGTQFSEKKTFKSLWGLWDSNWWKNIWMVCGVFGTPSSEIGNIWNVCGVCGTPLVKKRLNGLWSLWDSK